jgi:hypothetical protein
MLSEKYLTCRGIVAREALAQRPRQVMFPIALDVCEGLVFAPMSHGVPMIGCDCGVCRRPIRAIKRLRTSIVAEGWRHDVARRYAAGPQDAALTY